jgi:penicillin-binding protein 1A
VEAKIYRECERYYPFVLGAQPVRPVDLAAFYAAIANEGLRPSPHVIDAIERDGRTVYQHDPQSSVRIASVDRAAFHQLKTMLQGVLARGTAGSIAGLARYVGGKTGTTDDENDAWFVGFTNDVTVAVWIGYDNADGKRRTLGEGSTGGHVAVPIFESVIEAVWANGTAKVALVPSGTDGRGDFADGQNSSHGGDARRYREDGNSRTADHQRRRALRAGAYANRYRQDVEAREAGGWQGRGFAPPGQTFTGARQTFDTVH